MPALIPTDFTATITWLGAVVHRNAIEIETVPQGQTLDITWDGVAGAAHTGRTRPSDSRVKAQHTVGTEIANVRQLTLISAEEMADIAQALDLNHIHPEWLGANIVLEGLPDFSHIPPSSRLQAANGATLIVDMQNYPCTQVSKTIEIDRPGHGKRFKEVAKGRRGITAWVERPGQLALGDQLSLHIPEQRSWRGMTA